MTKVYVILYIDSRVNDESGDILDLHENIAYKDKNEAMVKAKDLATSQFSLKCDVRQGKYFEHDMFAKYFADEDQNKEWVDGDEESENEDDYIGVIVQELKVV